MLKTLAFALTLGAASALLMADAGAVPLAQGKQSIAGSDITLIREGCGPGRQYSQRLRRCVEDTPRAQMRDAVRDMVRPRGCGPGWHYSARFNRCVRN
jgi:hypothetical protein